jgi:hypothetical protein
MLVGDLTVEVRNSSLVRVGQILESDLVGSSFVPRFNNVGAWKVILPASHPMADILRAPGSGIIVTLSGVVILSGPTVSARSTKTATDPEGVWEIEGSDDSILLANRVAYPTPTTADVTAQTNDYDIRTGPAETVIKAYVNANLGPSAPVARRVPSLTIEADSARGDTVTGKARFDRLGVLLESLAITSGLGFTIDQNGAALTFRMFAPTDRSATIRMDVENERLEKSEYAYGRPTVTRVIVAGQGAGVDRTFVEVSSVDSLAAESDWAQRIESFKDQRNTNDTGELTQAGDEILADGGMTVRSVSVSPSDDQTMRYGVDWGLGDKVTVVVGDEQVSQIVTEVAIVITGDGVKVGATVGDPKVASASDPESVTAVATVNQENRISNLERNEPVSDGLPPGGDAGQILAKIDSADYNAEWVENYANWTSQVKHEVKLGENIAKGQAVYVSSADGTNIIVSKASNASEATSSKTMGLLETGGSTNAKVKVIVEGLLGGLDTSSAAAGDAVWLGVAGALIYGLASKPSAPAHLVFIGIVTRAHHVNGEIFVKPQNGFELNEIHDVDIDTPLAGQTILRNGSGLWQNTFSGVTSQNFLINGGFQFWQRGTSSTANATYIADRWIHSRSAGTHTASRSTDVPADADVEFSFSMASTSGTAPAIVQRIESVNSLQFAGQTVTLSVWAKSTVGTGALAWTSAYPTATDNWASETADTSGTFAASMTVGTWTRYTATFTANALATRGYRVSIYRNVTTTSTTTLYAGAQLEFGSVATRFVRAGATYTAEQMACFRYYQRHITITGRTDNTNVWKIIGNPLGELLRATPSSVIVGTISTPGSGGNIGTNVTLTLSGRDMYYTSTGSSSNGAWLNFDDVKIECEL